MPFNVVILSRRYLALPLAGWRRVTARSIMRYSSSRLTCDDDDLRNGWVCDPRGGANVTTGTPPSDVAFTPAVKAVQERRGSRKAYRRMEEKGGWQTTVTPDLAAFVAERDSAYLATTNALGQPYVQHRGGPKGFIRVLDDKTLGFADYVGAFDDRESGVGRRQPVARGADEGRARVGSANR